MTKPIIIIFLILLASCGQKQQNYTGTVLDHQTNKPLKGVRVNNYKDSTVTDSLGEFSLPARNGGPLLFKLAGFYTDSAKTWVNHSGEYTEELFDVGTIYLRPKVDQLRIVKVDTSQIYNDTRDARFYTRKSGESEYSLVIPPGFAMEKYNDLIIPVKASHYHYDITAGAPFITVTQLHINNIPCKLIAYTTAGENDTRVLNFQLNSYNNDYKLVDALLLDSRFTFDIEYYSRYRIYGDGNIRISRFSINKLEQNEQGDIIGQKPKPDTTIIYDIFKLDNHGRFIWLDPRKSNKAFNTKWTGSYYAQAHNKDNLITSFKLDITDKGNCSLNFVSDGEPAVLYRDLKANFINSNKLEVKFKPKGAEVYTLYVEREGNEYYFSGEPVYFINPGTEQISAAKQELKK